MRGHLPDGLLFINILYYGAEVAAEEEFRIMLTNAVRYLNRHRQSVSNSAIYIHKVIYLLSTQQKSIRAVYTLTSVAWCLYGG